MKSFDSHGRNAKLEDSKWGYSDGFKIQNGWKFQDLREPDKSVEPIMAETAQYSWVNKLVSNYNSQRTGNMFPAHGPYVMQKGDVPRGAGLSVQVLDHVELDYEPPSGYTPYNTRTVKGIDKVFSLSGARTHARNGYGL